jgi:hypothetical protein
MKKVVAIVGGGIVVVAAAVVIPRILDDTPETRTLTLTGSGASCTAADPGALGNRKNKRVTWTIVNQCASAQYVQFRDFKRKHLNDNEHDPIDNSVTDPYPPSTANPVPVNGTTTVEARINKRPKWLILTDTVKYDIYIGPNAANLTRVLDPDVEIWP